MVFHWSLSDSKPPQVSRTHLRILAVLSNAVVWIVSTRPPTSEFSRPFNNPLVIVPKATITIGTIITFMFHSFFNYLARSRYLSFFSFSFRFILWSAGTAKSTILQILFIFVDYFEVWSCYYYYYYYYTKVLLDFTWCKGYIFTLFIFALTWNVKLSFVGKYLFFRFQKVGLKYF